MKFSELGVSLEFEKNLEKLGIKTPRVVQKKSVEKILSREDITIQAQTGSGKTLTFSIGILENIDVKKFRIQALVIAPTRELAGQIATEMRKFAKHLHNLKILELVGGVPTKRQKHSLSHGAHIIIGTPGRLCHHLRDKTLDLKDVKHVVLDEADRILEMGFIEDIEEIFSFLPSKKQTMLFSATFPKEIQIVVEKFLENSSFIKIEEEKSLIEEFFIRSKEEEKKETTIKLLEHFQPKSTLIFCNTKIGVKDLSAELFDGGIDSIDLHGDLNQEERVETLVRFKNGSIRVLVATNLAARGLDISGLDLVINYDVAFDESFHTHRVGRTGRGEVGKAVTLVPEDYKEEVLYLQRENLLSQKFDGSENFTLLIEGGKRDKLRPGDIVGALTKSLSVAGNCIGDIDIFPKDSYVAVDKKEKESLKGVKTLQIKGKKFRVFVLK